VQCGFGNNSEPLCQCIVATYISRWTTRSQHNYSRHAHLNEGNQFGNGMNHGLKHEPIALWVMCRNMHIRARCLGFALTHAHLHALFGGSRRASNNSLRVQHRHCIKYLTASMQVALRGNGLPVGARNNSDAC
jgi:hypothetical protein